MAELRVKRGKIISQEMTVPGDKSISHRAVMIASLSNGPCLIDGFLPSEDCLSTVSTMRSLGVQIDIVEETPGLGPTTLRVHGRKMKLSAPDGPIDCGNSGTTIRLVSGILAAQPFECELGGDESLSKRPMKRIVEPLAKMGAKISARGAGGDCAPLVISGGDLKPVHYLLPVASAQVKSAILFAGLQTSGKTIVTEPAASRDHTEKMLNYFLVKTARNENDVIIWGRQVPESRDFTVPGDISSAAFWVVAAAAQPNSRLLVQKVGLNKTRTGILRVLIRMGAQIAEVIDERNLGEPMGSLEVKGGELTATDITGDEIPNVIDELPILAVAAALAKGTTTIRDAQELRVKETDRITAVANNLRAMGVNVQESYDGMQIEGGNRLRGTRMQSYGDHRIAMAFAVAGLFADGETIIEGAECIDISYPGFEETLKKFASSKLAEEASRPGLRKGGSKEDENGDEAGEDHAESDKTEAKGDEADGEGREAGDGAKADGAKADESARD
jgi:3-phosphoshikimate 1-carboxyvinyltransferase